MAAQKAPLAPHNNEHGSVLSLSIGFILSVILTAAAFLLVGKGVLSGWTILFALAGLATLQLLVQLVFFLHMGRETRPRWNLVSFGFMALIVGIVVIGTLWIMHNLDYNMGNDMSPVEKEEYMLEQKDKGF